MVSLTGGTCALGRCIRNGRAGGGVELAHERGERFRRDLEAEFAGLDDPTSAALLDQLVHLLDECEWMEAKIAEEGVVIDGARGQRREHPLLGALAGGADAVGPTAGCRVSRSRPGPVRRGRPDDGPFSPEELERIEAAVEEDRRLFPDRHDPTRRPSTRCASGESASAESMVLTERGVFVHRETGVETLDGLRRRVPAVDLAP